MIDNTLGLSYIVKSQKTISSKSNFNGESSKMEYSYSIKTPLFSNNLIPYSTHKIGYELIKNRLNYFIGASLNYDKIFIKGIHPSTSLQIKI